jgi:hypothetical protein
MMLQVQPRTAFRVHSGYWRSLQNLEFDLGQKGTLPSHNKRNKDVVPALGCSSIVIASKAKQSKAKQSKAIQTLGVRAGLLRRYRSSQ